MQNVRDAEIHRNYAYNTLYSNIRVSRCPRIDIHHNRTELTENIDNLSNKPPDNISIKNQMTGWAIHHNQCIDCGHQAIETAADASNGAVHNNYVENARSAAIQVHYSNHTPVYGNTVQGGASAAIVVDNIGAPVYGNTVDGCAASAIRVKLAEGGPNPIWGNTLRNYGAHGIFCDVETSGLMVIGNTMGGGTNDGVRLTSSGGSVSHQVAFNHIDGGRNGVRLQNNEGTKIVFNSIHNLDDPITADSACTDVDVRGLIESGNTGDVVLQGTRHRRNGIIGWFDGVDLSSTTGQFRGDMAIADGTSAASGGALAVWRGSGWDYYNPDGAV